MQKLRLPCIIAIIISFAFLSACSSNDVVNSKTKNSVPDSSLVQDSPVTLGNTNTQTQESTISKKISYRTDHGKHIVNATFDVSIGNDGTVTTVKATMNSGDHESVEYINRWNNAAESKIVGKKLSSFSVYAIGGASDTTEAFRQVVAGL